MNEPPPPLGVYLHWPYCARICPYCDFNVVRDRGRTREQAALVAAMAQDLRAQAALTGPRTLVSVFLGGGTPSLMDPGAAAELVALACSLWTPAPDLEVTLEANPTDAETQRFAGFAAAGVNRLSLGVQSLEDASLAFLGRNHDAAAARTALATATRVFPRVSLDLIYALPDQTEAAWRAELERAVGEGAEHLSPYQLTLEAGTPFDRAAKRGRFVPADPNRAAALFDATQALLEAHGFDAYEVSNHARGPAARSRHNLVYWTGADYAAAGPGAHGRLTLGGVRTALTAEPRIAAYIARVASTGAGHAAEPLDAHAAAEERLLLGLRIDAGVAWGEVAALGLWPDMPRVRELSDLGLLRADGDCFAATRAGRLVLDRVTARLAGA